MIIKSFSPALAAAAVLAASPLTAATIDLALTANPANLTTGSFTIGTSQFRTGTLFVNPFTSFTISQGDVIRTVLTLSAPLTVPGSMEQLFGLNFYQGGGSTSEMSSTDGTLTFSFSMGPTGLSSDIITGGCGNCITAIGGQVPGGPFTFDQLIVEQTITTLDTPFTIDGAAFTYQLRDLAVVVPEPGTWALLILGFGVIGAAMRRARAAVRFAPG